MFRNAERRNSRCGRRKLRLRRTFIHTLTLPECVSACKGVPLKQEGLCRHTLTRNFTIACSSFDWKYFKSTIFYFKMVRRCLELLSCYTKVDYHVVIICRLLVFLVNILKCKLIIILSCLHLSGVCAWTLCLSVDHVSCLSVTTSLISMKPGDGVSHEPRKNPIHFGDAQ